MGRVGIFFCAVVCATIVFGVGPADATCECVQVPTTTQPEVTTTTEQATTTTAPEATTSTTELAGVTSTLGADTTTSFVVNTTHPGSGEERPTTTLPTSSTEGETPNGNREGSGGLPVTGGGRTLAAFGAVALLAGLALVGGKRTRHP